MILLIYRLLCGYLYVRVTAPNPEKLLNLCAAKGIGIWRVSVRGSVVYFKIGITSFKKLRNYKRRIPCRIHITQKVGLPFFIAKNKKRYGMLCGVIIFFIIINLMSSCIWNICISGNKDIKSRDILNSLNKIGIYEGVSVSKIDPEEKRNELLLVQKGLSWAAVNIEGSKITVDVTETKAWEEKNNSASNFIAAEDAIIKKIEIKNGVTKIKVGDTVHKGQLLVSGIKEYDDGSVDFVKSMGSIYAEVKHTFKTVQPLKVTEFIKTGEKTQKKALRFFNFEIPLFLGGVEKPYIAYSQEEKISSGESYLPIKIITKKFLKTKQTTYTLAAKQAEKLAIEAAEKKVKEFVQNGEIITKQHKITFDDENLIITTEIKCLKDIVFEEKLLLDTSN